VLRTEQLAKIRAPIDPLGRLMFVASGEERIEPALVDLHLQFLVETVDDFVPDPREVGSRAGVDRQVHRPGTSYAMASALHGRVTVALHSERTRPECRDSVMRPWSIADEGNCGMTIGRTKHTAHGTIVCAWALMLMGCGGSDGGESGTPPSPSPPPSSTPLPRPCRRTSGRRLSGRLKPQLRAAQPAANFYYSGRRCSDVP
jgi:hypothetical protein